MPPKPKFTKEEIVQTALEVVSQKGAAALTAQELAAKDSKIAEQNQQLFAAQLAASQAAQNNYLVSTLRPSPSPAYVVANPYCCNSSYNYGCGNCA